MKEKLDKKIKTYSDLITIYFIDTNYQFITEQLKAKFEIKDDLSELLEDIQDYIDIDTLNDIIARFRLTAVTGKDIKTNYELALKKIDNFKKELEKSNLNVAEILGIEKQLKNSLYDDQSFDYLESGIDQKTAINQKKG